MKRDLYSLLPAVYRSRDYVLGGPLRALLEVLGDEVDAARRDVDLLYESWFIETCEEWLVPYIGDLLAVGGLHPGRRGVFSLRAFIANTLAYRRRKGTASVLENIAQDVTGWSAAVTEFFQMLITTQSLIHQRPTTVWPTADLDASRIGTVGALDLTKTPLLASLDTPFDTAARTIDIRPFTQLHGWYNVDRLGIFVWRVRSYPIRDAWLRVAPTAAPLGMYFHPLAVDAPLFVNPIRQPGATQRRREWEVPKPIGHDAFAADIERYYGADRSLSIAIDGVEVPIDRVAAADLSSWQPLGTPGATPLAYIDVELGRLLITDPTVAAADVRASYHYGFSADIGGGPYGRNEIAIEDDLEVIQVAKGTSVDSISAAFAAATGKRVLIRIMDNAIYEEDVSMPLAADREVIVEARDGTRPAIVSFPSWHVVGPMATGAPSNRKATLRLRGLLIRGALELQGSVVLDVVDCTVLLPTGLATVPGYGAVLAIGTGPLTEIDICRSIVGRIAVDKNLMYLHVEDSIIGAGNDVEPRLDAIGGANDSYGPRTLLERCTVFGPVSASELRASETIFVDPVVVERRQGGCVRYSYVAGLVDELDPAVFESRTPRRFRCQPDLVLAGVTDPMERARVRQQLTPAFSSVIYGQPDFARLASRCPAPIRTGAADGSEMGVFAHLAEPQREANLRAAVERYLPFGLTMNVLYADEESNR